MPRLTAAMAHQARLDPVFPAVTCSVQASMLTGRMPGRHGAVANGWYDRELGEVLMWRQHNRLVAGEKFWETARRRHPGYRVANLCWWFAMGAGTDISVTPRPVYHADGRKSPDCYTTPPALRDELTAEFGPFPLFAYWGPGASIASTRWIAEATGHVIRTRRPDATLAYLPHLDYDLQRFGPASAEARAAAAALDREIEPLLRAARQTGTTVVAVSEYGITPVRRPVHINRALRAAGLLAVYRQAGMEYLDPWTSRAFAVADHQVAHVYVAHPADCARVRSLLEGLPGVETVLDADGKAVHGLDHGRSGDLVAVADSASWFTYYYWRSDRDAPDFARCVEIHRKPGYDPAELLPDPNAPAVRLRLLGFLARRRLGLRAVPSVVPLDAGWVRGSHGRMPAEEPDDAPVLLISDAGRLADPRARYHATELPEVLLTLAGLGRYGCAESTVAPGVDLEDA